MNHVTPYMLSVEPTAGKSFVYGCHLGTDLRVARDCAIDIFFNRKWFSGMGAVTVRTVALMSADRKLIDVYDGEWSSERIRKLIFD